MSNSAPHPHPDLRPPSRRRALVLLLIAACGLAGTSFADEVPAAEARRIQAVITDQLAAFAADDARRAFAHASAALQRQFGDAERFLAMVRTAYPVVYRPATVAFLRPELTDGQWTQGLHLTDARGARWLAVYVMQRRAGKAWRIGGCTLVAAPGQTAGSTPPWPVSTARA